MSKLSSSLVREGEVIFGTAVDAYGRILKDLERVFTTPERRARMGIDLEIIGDATSLVRELLDELETLRPTCGPSRGGLRRPVPEAANDDDDLPD